MSVRMTRAATSLLILLLAAACDGGPSATELARLDRERADATDPAITAALEDPIMTDRDLSVTDHSRRVRYVPGPAEASTPARITANAAVYNALKALETPPPACHRGFQKGSDWAARMPAQFAPPAGATLWRLRAIPPAAARLWWPSTACSFHRPLGSPPA